MTITPINGEPFRFLVSSDTEGEDPYLVDLTSYRGNGRCACPHFKYRLQRNAEVRMDDAEVTDEFRCKHIMFARSFFVDSQIAGYVTSRHEERGDEEAT